MTQPATGTTTQNGQVSESSLNFRYELPNTAPDPGFRDLEAQAIAEIEREFYAEEPAPESADPTQEELETSQDESAAEQETKPEVEDDAVEPDVESDPKLARGVERLVSRELKAREEEAKAQATLAAVRAETAALKELKGLKPAKQLAEQMMEDPWGALKTMGHDPDHVVRVIMAQSIKESGDEVPEGLKKYLKDSGDTRRIKALEAKIAEQERAQAAATYYKGVDDGAREYVTKNVDVKKYPTVSTAIKADLNFVHREIMEEIVRDSQVRAASDPDGDPMPYEQAVANVEARWAKYRALFSGTPRVPGQVQNGTTPDTKLAPGQKKVAPLESSRVPPQTKPAARPLAPWQRSPEKDDPFENGIQEALREYNAMEAKRKQRQG